MELKLLTPVIVNPIIGQALSEAVAIDATVDAAATVQLAQQVFTKKFNEPLIHQVVCAYLAGARAGTRAQKTRAEVRGGGRKPWRQKGTGQARAGTIRSPLWRGGGVVFPSKTENFAQKLNKKMYSYALASILSELLRQQRLLVVANFPVISHKTRDLVQQLAALKLTKVLIVLDQFDGQLTLAARNLTTVKLVMVNELNPVDLVGHEQVLFTTPALKKLEERLLCTKKN